MNNTLVTPSMVLGLAMIRVVATIPPDADPFEVTAEFELPDGFAVMTHDELNQTVLRPAIEAAMAERRPVGRWIEYDRHDEITEAHGGSVDAGILGRFLHVYDYPADRALGRIDIRVLKPELLVEA